MERELRGQEKKRRGIIRGGGIERLEGGKAKIERGKAKFESKSKNVNNNNYERMKFEVKQGSKPRCANPHPDPSP